MEATPDADYSGENGTPNGEEYDPTSAVAHPDGEDQVSDDEYDPSALATGYQPEYTPEIKIDGDMAETANPYDPVASGSASLGLPRSGSTSQVPSRTASRASAKSRPRTVGGFVMDDEDEASEEESNGGNGAPYDPTATTFDEEEEEGSVEDGGLSKNENQNELISESHVPISQAAATVKTARPKDSSVSPIDAVAAVSNNADPALQSDASSLPHSSGLVNAAIVPQIDSAATSQALANMMPTGRLAHDRVGILEDRIKEDPRGDSEAWMELIAEHRRRNKFDEARDVYERFFKVFPMAADQWVAYAQMETELNELYRVEQIFNKTLLTIPSVQLWSIYLDYVRRRNNLMTDSSGQARKIITSAYDFALQNIGVDKDSAPVWLDYISFLKSGPGAVGGTGWEDQQKMDTLRKAYHKATSVPMEALATLWREYDQFEHGLNKLTAKKFLRERSPAYMTARSSSLALQNITKDLARTSLPRLPPAMGFEGDEEYNVQLGIWKRWLEWEKEDPLVLKQDDLAAFKSRVTYVYRQAHMAMRFEPVLFFDAAEFCFANGMENEGVEFLKQGIAANPESCLLAFKRSDHLELTSEGEQDSKKRGEKVREPYDNLLDTLYELINKARDKETKDVARIEEYFASIADPRPSGDNDDEDDFGRADPAQDAAKNNQIDAVRKGSGAQIQLLSRTISFAWIALMRAMRRVQGKGKPGEMPGSRQIFADARKRGRITSDVYIASALLEYHCYKDPAATKIFERGAKLFPEDETFALEYLKHLIAINDVTNARAVFETTVRRLIANPANVHKAKPIFAFLHEYEAHYGDLYQVNKLEARMTELFPEDPSLRLFSSRFTHPIFDPTAIRPMLSATQARPKLAPPPPPPAQVTSLLPDPSMNRDQSPSTTAPPPRAYDQPQPTTNAAIPQQTNSPKRPLPSDFENDADPSGPRKLPRGESPLKGAAGRRLDAQKRAAAAAAAAAAAGGSIGAGSGSAMGGMAGLPPPPPPLPKHISFLLSIIPGAATYNATRFNPEGMVELLRKTNVPDRLSSNAGYGRY